LALIITFLSILLLIAYKMKNSRRPLGLSLDIRQAEKIFEDESEQQESKSYTGLKTAGDYSFKCTLSSKFNLQNQN
jgi:hypothetical protein